MGSTLNRYLPLGGWSATGVLMDSSDNIYVTDGADGN